MKIILRVWKNLKQMESEEKWKMINCLALKVERGREQEEARGTGMGVRGDKMLLSIYN